ncbi:hypothetical protein CK203_000427 [Vitis vinifera]|uniref:Uncharacterized protein n=1 Tax=Vitis vinifera TaxID=29760 RepID=A0A438KQ46_VITVI|nr:hypothetical protein CK203_000427 [Vitis vinifera]
MDSGGGEGGRGFDVLSKMQDLRHYLVGCSKEEVHVDETWVKILGLPLFLCDKGFFKEFGDASGGFVAVDEDTANCCKLQWVRVLLKTRGLVLAHKKRKAPFYKLTCFLSATLRMRMMFACCSRRDLRLRFPPRPTIIDEALVEEALCFLEKEDLNERINYDIETGDLIEGVPTKGSFGKLLVFSRFVGMPIEGFDSEILALLQRLESRKKGRSPHLGKKKETKVQHMSEMLVRKLGVGRFLNWETVDWRGQFGGILVFWDNRVLELPKMEMSVHSLSWRFKNCDDNFIWVFFGVYGPVSRADKEELFPRERRNCSRISSTMKHFSEIIEEFHLRDLPLAGESHFNGLSQKLLPKPTSDHASILLDGCGIRNGKTPFSFESMWLKEEGFKDLVRRWWTSYTFNGSFSHIFVDKLKTLKQDLKT